MAPPEDYRPAPIRTTHVTLPRQLQPLLECLAEHVHDLWAAQRMEEAWRWGPCRSDAARTHPSLIPYAELTEGEKKYDRLTASETLRAIIALGYRIVPPSGKRLTNEHSSEGSDGSATNSHRRQR